MSDRLYPIDIHGCAQGDHHVLARSSGTSAPAARPPPGCCNGRWTICGTRAAGWFYYQRRRGFRTRIRELRWCQGWMSWALASYLENCGGRGVKGFPGRELSLDPGPQPVRAAVREPAGRAGQRAAHPAATGAARHRGLVPAILDAGCGSGVFSYELAKRHPEAQVIGVELEPELVARANEIAKRAQLSNCSFQEGDVTKLDFEDAVRPGGQRRQPRARRGRRRGDADAAARAAPWRAAGRPRPRLRAAVDPAAAAGSTSTSPATSGPGTGPRSWSAS